MDRHVAARLAETRFCLCEPALAGVAIHRTGMVFVLLYIVPEVELYILSGRISGGPNIRRCLHYAYK